MPTAFSTRRLAAVAAVLFVLVLAFLAGRVHAGADPAQLRAPASSPVQAEPAPEQGTPDEGAPDQSLPDPDPPATYAS